MPEFMIKTLEKYKHVSYYDRVVAETATEAVQKVKAGDEAYDRTTISEFDPGDEFIEVLEIFDEDGNEVDIPEDV